MKLLDPTWIRDRVDYSFGDESGISIGGYMKPANNSNQEFMDRYRVAVSTGARYMTLFIDNIRLYRRSCIRYTAVEQINPTWKQLKDEKVQRFQNEDLLQLLSTLPDMRFIIFTGFEDTPTDEAIFDAIPDNVLAIYASNAIVYGGKVHPIPYGLQRVVAPSDNRQQTLEHSIPHTVQVNKLMYINYNPGNHPSRQHLINTYQNQPWVTITIPGSNPLPQYGQYLNEIRAHKFMLCPSGNADGCECHRDWETIYMRRVPIVIDTPYHRAVFEPLHVPVLYVDDLTHITEQLLLDNDYLYQQMQTYDLTQLDIEVLYNKCIEQVNEQLSNKFKQNFGHMNVLITGAGGMIGTHLTNRLKEQGHYVVGVDIKHNEFTTSTADMFLIQDLTQQSATSYLFDMCPKFDWVFNLAAVMGGMEYLANGDCDYKVLNESTLINWNVLDNSIRTGVKRIFFSSSACAYNMTLQERPDSPALRESDAYPVLPDLEYGYQKLISERIYSAADRCSDIEVRIARFHNIYGPYTEWEGIKAKAPAALCRKVAEADMNTWERLVHWPENSEDIMPLPTIDVIGDGLQTRSFTWIDDCIDGILRLMESDCNEPVNIGSDEMIAINDLAQMIIDLSGKQLSINNIEGPQGVRGRNSDNTFIQQKLGWKPPTRLVTGIPQLYEWVSKQVDNKH